MATIVHVLTEMSQKPKVECSTSVAEYITAEVIWTHCISRLPTFECGRKGDIENFALHTVPGKPSHGYQSNQHIE